MAVPSPISVAQQTAKMIFFIAVSSVVERRRNNAMAGSAFPMPATLPKFHAALSGDGAGFGRKWGGAGNPILTLEARCGGRFRPPC